MCNNSRPSGPRPHVLATDLDGTLIPLPDHPQNRLDLDVLRESLTASSVTLAFVTGRHLKIVKEAIVQHQLPCPDWILCDVGTTIYRNTSNGWQLFDDYADHLAQLCKTLSLQELRHRLALSEDLTLQEDEKQGPFKLSYYVAQCDLETLTSRIDDRLVELQAPYSTISSVDPFTGDGLIDLLPTRVSKAYAIEWWRSHCGIDRERIIFAGDSGNDLAPLTAGYLSIVVGNADRTLAEHVEQELQQQGLIDQLHLAVGNATSGVLEGCRAFGLFES